MSTKNIYTIFDIGTARVLCVIARISNEEKPEVIGIGYTPSQGINSGAITDMTKAKASLEMSIRSAEQMAQEKVQQVYLNISGYNTFSIISEIDVITENGKVSEYDLHNLNRKAFAAEKNNCSMIHCITLHYTVDGLDGISNPIGMQAKKLGAKLHIIAAHKSRLYNISQCLTQCSINISDYVASAYNVGLACLTETEKDMGCVMLDIGAKSTTIAAYQDNKIIYSNCIALGGLHITKDIACGLSISIEQAEKVKTLHGNALRSVHCTNELVEISDLNNNPNSILVSKETINSIINARVEEIFELVQLNLRNASIDASVTQRTVLTGGCNKLLKMSELAAKILHSDTRIGSPNVMNGVEANDLSYTSAIGTIMHIQEQLKKDKRAVQKIHKSFVENLWQWIKEGITQ